MTTSRWPLVARCVVLLGVVPLFAQVAPKANDLMGTWELVSAKNVKTGLAVPPNSVRNTSTHTEWMQFTPSHWMLINQAAGRKFIPLEEFNKLSPEAKVKANYALVWNDKNERLYQARGGTYAIKGDMLHMAVAMIISADVGSEQLLKIIRLDKSTMVAQTVGADPLELAYRRLD